MGEQKHGHIPGIIQAVPEYLISNINGTEKPSPLLCLVHQ